MRLLALPFLLALLACTAFAQSIEITNATPDFISGVIRFEAPDFLQKIVSGANASTERELEEKTLVVVGGNIDLAEMAIFDSAKAQYPLLANAKSLPDSQEAVGKIDSGYYALVILVGGPQQNSVAKEMSGRKIFNESVPLEGGLSLQYGKTPGGTLVVVFSDGKKAALLQRESVKYSPLSQFIPPAYVPAAATGISLLLLAAMNVVRTVFEFKALNIGRKGKKVGGSRLVLFGRNMAEPLALIGASVVLGVSISWQYFGPGPAFAEWVGINTAICFLAGIAHELTHRAFAHLFRISVEYRFWPTGSALTLVSSYLGNAFSVQGFLLEDIPAHTAKWKVGLMKLAAPMLSTAVMVFFAWYNSLHPDAVFEAVYTISALWAMAEMLPFSGLDGKDIKEWNPLVWLASFLLVAACYVFVTFIM